jgi:Chaperonin 10 Kd subunit
MRAEAFSSVRLTTYAWLPLTGDSRNRRKETITFVKIRPLGDRILVKRIKEEDQTKGGIIIPDTAKEKPQEGKIVAVGKGEADRDRPIGSPGRKDWRPDSTRSR